MGVEDDYQARLDRKRYEGYSDCMGEAKQEEHQLAKMITLLLSSRYAFLLPRLIIATCQVLRTDLAVKPSW